MRPNRIKSVWCLCLNETKSVPAKWGGVIQLGDWVSLALTAVYRISPASH